MLFRISFSKKWYFFCILALENQQAFSERCSLISGVMQGLVKICKKYMEVNYFLLLFCSLEKKIWWNDSLIIALVDNAQFSAAHSQNFLSGSNYFRGKFYSEETNFQETIFLGGSCPERNHPGGKHPGGNYAGEQLFGGGAIFLEGNCPRTL